MSKPKVLSERQWFKHSHPTSLIRHLEATKRIRQKGRDDHRTPSPAAPHVRGCWLIDFILGRK